MTMIINIVSVALILSGILFFFGAVVGVTRFPDVYTRMHAAGKGDTLSGLLVVLGFAVYHLGQIHGSHFIWADLLVVAKLLAICAFIMLTSPAATHALMDAGYEDGVEPLLGEDGDALTRGKGDKQGSGALKPSEKS